MLHKKFVQRENQILPLHGILSMLKLILIELYKQIYLIYISLTIKKDFHKPFMTFYNFLLKSRLMFQERRYSDTGVQMLALHRCTFDINVNFIEKF